MDRPSIRFNYHSAKEALRILGKNPIALIDYVGEGITVSIDNQFIELCRLLGWHQWDVEEYLYGIRNKKDFQITLRERLGFINYGQMVSPEILYVIIRLLRPKIVVETGVSAGVSSAFILQALEDNEHGELFSIDYPNYAINEANNVPKTGFAVPEYLHNRWTLHIGKSQDLLVPVLEDCGNIDLFLHDSEHSYNNMLWEYETAWMKLRDGGLLMSHDINDNTAFSDFSNEVKHKYTEIFFTGIGIIKK
jgi:predicted O-methyltransferase YrrM